MSQLLTAKRKQRGFTLLELIVVMVILVLLAGVVSVAVMKRVEDAKHAKAVADVESLGAALDHYYLDNGQYPTTEEGLDALLRKPQGADLPKWSGPYIKKAVPDDPWKRPYDYKCPGEHNADSFDLYSLGKDGKENGDNNDADIVNWDTSESGK